MELTPKGMPTSLRPFLQEYVLEEIDPDDHPFTVTHDDHCRKTKTAATFYDSSTSFDFDCSFNQAGALCVSCHDFFLNLILWGSFPRTISC